MVMTQKKNATKHVTQPLIDAKQKRRTKAEIKADKQHLEKQCQKVKEECQARNEYIASIQDR